MAVTGNKATSTKSSAARSTTGAFKMGIGQANAASKKTSSWTLPKKTSTTTVQPNANRPINPGLTVQRMGETSCVLVPWVDTARVNRGSASAPGTLLFEKDDDPAYGATEVQVDRDRPGSPIRCTLEDCEFTLRVTDFGGTPVVPKTVSALRLSPPELNLGVSNSTCEYRPATCPHEAGVERHVFALGASALNIGSINSVDCSPSLDQDLRAGLDPVTGLGSHVTSPGLVLSQSISRRTSSSREVSCTVGWTGLEGETDASTFTSTCSNQPPACTPEDDCGVNTGDAVDAGCEAGCYLGAVILCPVGCLAGAVTGLIVSGISAIVCLF